MAKKIYNWTLPKGASLTLPECNKIAQGAKEKIKTLGFREPIYISGGLVFDIFEAMIEMLKEQDRLDDTHVH